MSAVSLVGALVVIQRKLLALGAVFSACLALLARLVYWFQAVIRFSEIGEEFAGSSLSLDIRFTGLRRVK